MGDLSKYRDVLIGRLLGVDGPVPGAPAQTSPASTQPEVIAPSGSGPTSVDTGAPARLALLGISLDRNVLVGAGVILGVLALVGIARKLG